MQPYPGQDGSGLTMPTPTTGKGIFPTPQVVTGGDNRSAQNHMAAPEADRDCIVWLGYRVKLLNPYEGSSGDAAATATITNYNHWIYNGQVDLAGQWYIKHDGAIVAGKTAYVGDPATTLGVGHVVVKGGSDVTLDGSGGSDAAIVADGAHAKIELVNGAGLTVDSTSAISSTGTAHLGVGGVGGFDGVQIGLVQRTSGARTELRQGRPASPDADQTFDPSQWDVLYLGDVTLTADRTWKLAAPAPGNRSHRVEVLLCPGGGHTLQFQDAFSANLFHLTSYSGGGCGVILIFNTQVNKWIPLLGVGANYVSDLP